MKKECLNPELKDLSLVSTQETKYYCESRAGEEVVTYKGAKLHRPGHRHKPNNPYSPTPIPNLGPDPEDPTPAS